uniref:SJCHGC02743 protein n=1 Tax=Schistosoma japonicum TaxID=6182 RepID=Q5DHC4_SCHJA|nr:SJCHGC02743 protein [Schistosoma japonicum]
MEYMNFINESSIQNFSSLISNVEIEHSQSVTPWTITIFIVGIICLIVGSILELLIIFVDDLHIPSLRNYVLLTQAAIFLTVGYVVVNSFLEWKLQIIGAVLTFIAVTLITIFVVRISRLKREVRIILFTFSCIFILLGNIFFGLSFTYPGFKIGFAICCICTMLIVAVTITYHLRLLSASTIYYLPFSKFLRVCAIWFEFILLYFPVYYLESSVQDVIYGNNSSIYQTNMMISLYFIM